LGIRSWVLGFEFQLQGEGRKFLRGSCTSYQTRGPSTSLRMTVELRMTIEYRRPASSLILFTEERASIVA